VSVVELPRSGIRSNSVTPARPGSGERAFVVMCMLLYSVSLPQNWFIVVTPNDPAFSSNESTTGALGSIVFLGLAGIAFLLVWPHLHLVFRLTQLVPSLSILAGYLVLSTLWSVDPDTTFRRSLGVAATVFVAMYLVVRFERHEILRYAAVVCGVTIWLNAAFVFGLPQYGVMPFENWWSGLYFHKNELGMNTALGVIILVLQLLASRRARALILATIGLGVVLLIGAQSATSLSATVLVLALLAVFQLFRARRTLFGAVALSLVTASGLGLLVATANLPLITDLLGRDITLTGRSELWAAMIPVIEERPWLGFGYSAFWRGWFTPAHEVWIATGWMPPTGHNAAFDYLAELGIMGLGLVLGYFFSAVVKATRDLRDRAGAVGSLPITVLSLQLLFSVTESGLIGRSLPWLLVSTMVFSVAVSQASLRSPSRAVDPAGAAR
jgi:exopolysaccharide production protein ExoQ